MGEVDLFRHCFLEQIQSASSGCQQFSSHKSVVAGCDPLANTIHESATAVQSRRNFEIAPISLSLQKQEEDARTSPEVLWCIFLYEIMTNDDQQRGQSEPMPQHP